MTAGRYWTLIITLPCTNGIVILRRQKFERFEWKGADE
jgi:hypothetical protein